jgi:hypothetical protein
MSTRVSKLPRTAGTPKSTVCEVQQWTTVALKEVQGTKERFIPLPPRSDDPEGGRCEVFRWAAASADEVLAMKAKDTGLKMRCVECKQPVRFQRARLAVGNAAPHFGHYERNESCSQSDL